MFDNKSIDQQVLDICDKLFERSLNCKIQNNEIRFSPEDEIHDDQLFLLFTLPGILILALSSIAGNKEYLSLIRATNTILHQKTDGHRTLQEFCNLIPDGSMLNTIKEKSNKFTNREREFAEFIERMNEDPISDNMIDKFLETLKSNDPDSFGNFLLKHNRRNLPPGFEMLTILLNPISTQFNAIPIHYNQITVLDALLFSLGNYFALAFMTYANFPSRNENECFFLEDIEEMHSLCDEKIGRFSEYNGFLENIQMISEYIISELKDSKNIYKYQRTMALPSKSMLFLHKYSIENSSFYTLDRSPLFQSEFDFQDNRSIGFAINTNILNEFGFELIMIASINKPFLQEYDFLKGMCWFIEEDKKDYDDYFSFLSNLTYRMGKKCSSIVSSIMTSWDEFIDNPGEKIDSQFSKFDEWFKSALLESYETRDELLKATTLSRMFGNIDNEIFTDDAEEIRKLYKEAKSHHLPIELEQKLLDADKELKAFIDNVVSKKDQDGNPIIKNRKKLFSYAIKKKDDYNHLKLLHPYDVERITFAKEGNTIRDNRRIILSRLYKKLCGKEPKSMTEVTKKLGLESGKESYLKWSK